MQCLVENCLLFPSLSNSSFLIQEGIERETSRSSSLYHQVMRFVTTLVSYRTKPLFCADPLIVLESIISSLSLKRGKGYYARS